MLTSSPSPTLSAPNSPATFHRPYHARPSPRFPPQQRRAPLDPPASLPIPIVQTASLSSAREEQTQQHEYADAGTQYTPPGLPPTARPARQQQRAASQSSSAGSVSRGGRRRRVSSPEIVATEPQEKRVAPEEPAAVRRDESRHGPPSSGGIEVERQQPAVEEKRDEAQSSSNAASVTAVEAQQQQKEQPSPLKRARNDSPDLKVMPLKYELCDVKDLGVLISDMLMELVRLNDGIPLQDGQLTRFHSRAPPGISVRDYLTRLIVHATLQPPILLSMVYYVDKLCSLYPAFTISSLTVHRFLITAATVAAKGLSDSFWTNSLYAKVGGVSVRELALLELEFLRRLDWRIVPKPEVLVDYYKGLVERGAGYTMEKEASPVPPSTGAGASTESGSSSSMDVFMEPATPAPPADSGA